MKNFDFIYNFSPVEGVHTGAPSGGNTGNVPPEISEGVGGAPSTGEKLYIKSKFFTQTGQKLVKFNVFH